MQVHPVPAVFLGQGAGFVSESLIYIDIGHLFLLRHLLHQLVVNPQVVVGQVIVAGGGQVLLLVYRDQALDVDDCVGLNTANLINGGTEFVVVALVVVVAQLVDAQGDVYLAVFLQGQRF